MNDNSNKHGTLDRNVIYIATNVNNTTNNVDRQTDMEFTHDQNTSKSERLQNLHSNYIHSPMENSRNPL